MADAPYTDWDDTDASNSAIDGSAISEGCAPGGINNALRAWRGSLARLLHSWTGQKVTGGTANVQTLTSGLSLSGTPEALVVFTAGSGLTNTGACTLTVDSMDAKSVKVSGADGSLDDPAAGAISAGAVHMASYEATAGAWVLLNPSRQESRIVSITSSATPTPNADITDQYNVTALATDPTFGAPTGTPVDGQYLRFRIKDDGTGRTLSWNAAYRGISGITPPSSTTASKTLYCHCIYNAADSKWDMHRREVMDA